MPTKSEKLLEGMRRSPHNWTRRDLDALYEGFGFQIENRRRHDIVTHPKFPQLTTTLARHRVVLRGYIKTAIEIIAELQKLSGSNEQGMDAE